MCRLYGFRANEATKVECGLVHAQNALMRQSESDLAGYSHAHGWGVAAYEDHRPRIERQAWAAYHGEHFRRAAARIYAKSVLAHVRRATVGPPGLANTHPFAEGCWALIHNGTVPAFEALRPRFLDAISPRHRAAIEGVTDSEHLFRLFLTRCEAAAEDGSDEGPSAVLRRLLADVGAWCRSEDSDADIGLNLIVTDGHQMVGSRWGRGLYLTHRDGIYDCEVCGFPHVRHEQSTAYRAVVIASEPLTHEDWSEVPDHSLFEVTPDFGLRIEPL